MTAAEHSQHRSRRASERALLLVIFAILAVHALFLCGLLYVMAHAQMVSFTLSPRGKALSLSTPAAANGAFLLPRSSANTRSVVPAAWIHLPRGIRGLATCDSQLAGPRFIAGTRSFLPGASDTAVIGSAQAAGELSDFRNSPINKTMTAAGAWNATTRPDQTVHLAMAVSASHIGRRRARRAHGYPVSRDAYADDVKCSVSYCPCNRVGRCALPSQIEIRADGVCQKAIDFKKPVGSSQPT